MKRNTRKFISLLLCFCMLLPLSACGAEGGIRRNRDVLTVCIDDDFESLGFGSYMLDFTNTLKYVTGIEDIEFIYLPENGVERETMIQRMRTELMSGAGPDVFITFCSHNSYPLFPYTEKVMNNGFFLPLDDYMENHSQFTDWDKQDPVILEAGRNEEGQQLIPLDYSFAVQVHPKSELDIEKPDHPVTFEEALSDPGLSALYSKFYNCSSNVMWGGEITEDSFFSGLAADIMGKPADFEKEELGFTEEELLSVMETIFALPKDEDLKGGSYEEIIDVGFLPNYDQPFTLLPLYTTDGGLHAEIGSFIAINRNTKRPEEAFTFLDYFMSEKIQQNSIIAGRFNYNLPLFSDAYRKEHPHQKRYLIPEAFEELTETKEQITSVSFYDEISSDLSLLFSNCREAYKAGASYEELVHEAYDQMLRKVRE